MKTIRETIVNEYTVNKSKFITVLTNINDKNEVNNILNKYKNIYKCATHYCYGYIIDGCIKCTDDKEPSGTAGLPILNVLKNNNLNYVLCIVIRYFGGVKLGAGGLTRAYSKSVSQTIKKAQICDMVDGYNIKIEFNYDNIKSIDSILKNIDIKKTYSESIIYEFNISKSDFALIEKLLKEKANIIKQKSVLIKI